MRSAVRRSSMCVPIRCLVDTLYQVTGLLKFNRKIKRRRNVYPLHFLALWICAARANFVGPKSNPRRIWLPIKEIMVVLPDIALRIIEWVAPRLNCVVHNLNRGNCRLNQTHSHGIRQNHVEGLVALDQGILVDENSETL